MVKEDMRKKTLISLFLLFILLILALPSPASSKVAIVRAVLLHSPTCGHCEKVINDVLPPIQETYGEQLEILLINIKEPAGQKMYESYINAYQVPGDRRGVPALVIGDTYLVGSKQIPEEFPGIIDSLLAEGGVGWPDIPGIGDLVPVSSTTSMTEPAQEGPGWQQRFMQDPLANTIAVIVLIGMTASLLYNLVLFLKPLDDDDVPRTQRFPWLVPVLCVAGLFVSGYLTYIEVTNRQAVCGPVGDCNSVQQSPYATVFGFLPVAILGLLGYAGILAAWAVYQYGPRSMQKFAALAMWGMVIFGVLFSIYLTFLEPFVIGATCAWCITTAIIMTVLLWITTRQATTEMALEVEKNPL
jgi:uncharacterized membrane protein